MQTTEGSSNTPFFLKDWTERFWEWIYQTTDDANPVSAVGPARPWRYGGRQPTVPQLEHMKQFGESTWFIAASPYAEPGSIIKINIPVGKWSILAAPAISCVSQQEYPSLDGIEKLADSVHKNISKVYELWTILDGFSIPWYYVDNTDRLIKISNIPAERSKNVYNLSTATVDAVQCGYWNYILPLEPGDHLLVMHSASPYYKVDVTYQLSVVGPSS